MNDSLMNEKQKQELDKMMKEYERKQEKKRDYERKKNKIKSLKIPNKLIVYENKDKKGWHEKWTKNRRPLNLPHPFRCLLIGRPNSGKSNVVCNLIINAQPEFKRIILVHCDLETTEYDHLGDIEKLDAIPTPDEFEVQYDEETGYPVKTLMIIDDLEVKNLDRKGRRALDRAFGYLSTHCGISITMCVQDMYQIGSTAPRRCSNVIILWPTRDMDCMGTIARKIGYRKKDFIHLFESNIRKDHWHDALWFDLTPHSPYPIRRNGTEIITIEELEED